MGSIRPFAPVQLIVGVLSVQLDLNDRLMARMEEAFGPVHLVTEAVPFTFTNYYDAEMGARPYRYFMVFETLISPDTLAACKLKTNRIEQEFAGQGGRTINLDPGILSAENIILATTKNRGHRIPLNDGIYAEITLIYQNRSYQSLPWTYADYASDDFRALFNTLREQYMRRVK